MAIGVKLYFILLPLILRQNPGEFDPKHKHTHTHTHTKRNEKRAGLAAQQQAQAPAGLDSAQNPFGSISGLL